MTKLPISALNEIASNLSVDELKQKLHGSYETLDTLKFAEFDPKYAEWPAWMRKQLRSSSINSPTTNYLGKFNQGSFKLFSPRFFYWRNVIVYVRYAKTNSLLIIELEYFKLTMYPLVFIWSASLLVTIYDFRSGLVALIVSSIFLSIKLLKAWNTLKYFKKYAS